MGNPLSKNLSSQTIDILTPRTGLETERRAHMLRRNTPCLSLIRAQILPVLTKDAIASYTVR